MDFKLELNYGSRHGKSAAEGAAVVAKRLAKRGVTSKQTLIRDAEEFHKYMSLNHTIEPSDLGCSHYLMT